MMGNAPCLHFDGEFCPRCYESPNKRGFAYLQIELSKEPDGTVDVKLIGDPIKLNEFGFNTEKFGSLGAHISYLVKKIYMGDK